MNPNKMGCDLRPANPDKIDPASLSCCGAEAPDDSATHAVPHPTPAGASAGYYQPQDLVRVSESGRANPKPAGSFFACYGQVMGKGNLNRREKALIALAVAQALQYPYCIDSDTASLHKLNVSEAEMSEAVHVASAMAAGIASVHGVQMMNKLDQLAARHETGAGRGVGAKG